MSDRKVRATACIQVVLELAADDALGQLRRGLVVDGLTTGGDPSKSRVHLVGRPVVTAILCEEQR